MLEVRASELGSVGVVNLPVGTYLEGVVVLGGCLVYEIS